MVIEYEFVVGLEVHAEVSSATKLFCSCKNSFGDEPNSHTCPVCLGHPGTLPQVNQKAIVQHAKAGFLLNCSVLPRAQFDRKHYFYPDMPKNYQTTQLYAPMAVSGFVPVSSGKSIRVERIHLEEDTGKSNHFAYTAEGEREDARLGQSDGSLLDYNRAGVPLLEIVSMPDFFDVEDVLDYLEYIRQQLSWFEISECKMEEGSLRADINISVREKGAADLGKKVEVKNVNSLRSVRSAIEYEFERQVNLLEQGEAIQQETRGWDEVNQVTLAQRSKEEAEDYCYLPDPDLPSIEFASSVLSEIEQSVSRSPYKLYQSYLSQYDLDSKSLDFIFSSREHFEFFEALLGSGLPVDVAIKWFLNDLSKLAREKGCQPWQGMVTPEALFEVYQLIQEDVLSNKGGQKLIKELFLKGGDVLATVDALKLRQVTCEETIKAWVDEVLAEEVTLVEAYRAGEEKALQSLCGKVMKLSRGIASPKKVQEVMECVLA